MVIGKLRLISTIMEVLHMHHYYYCGTIVIASIRQYFSKCILCTNLIVQITLTSKKATDILIFLGLYGMDVVGSQTTRIWNLGYTT